MNDQRCGKEPTRFAFIFATRLLGMRFSALPYRGRIAALNIITGTALIAVNACSNADSALPERGVVAIGIGAIPGSPGYESVTRGIQMAVDKLNETEGTGVSFRLRFPDSSSTSAVQIAQQLRDDRSVIAVVGHPESGNTLEVLPIYEDAEHQGENAVVAVSPTASSPRLSGISPWFYRVAPSDDDAARHAANWVIDSLGASRAAIIYRNDSYGRDWSTTFASQFRQRGGIIAIRDPYLTQITEWEAYALHVAELKPDVVLFPGDAPDALEFLDALRNAKVEVPFLGGDGTEGMRDDARSQGARFVSFYQTSNANDGEALSFVQRYRERHSMEPDMFAALSYDAALVIGKAVQTGARSRSAVRDALGKFGKDGVPAVEGAGGQIAFNASQDIASRSVVIAHARRSSH